MVPVRDYKSLWEFIKTDDPRIDHLFMVDDETELSNKIEEVSDGDIILVAVYPASDSQALDEDNLFDVDTCVIYVLQKIEQRNINDDDLMDERALTQQILTHVRETMTTLMFNHVNNTNHRIMKQVIRGKQHIDRERNYLGCNGWSLSFSLKTNGINNQTY